MDAPRHRMNPSTEPTSDSGPRDRRVLVLGAGLGGISAAISLAQEGYDVTVIEKNARIGGKLNLLETRGYTFDLGPSILTLPHLFERLFDRSGKKMADYIPIRPLLPHWRNFFEDGAVIDLHPDPGVMAVEAAKVGENPQAVRDFLDYSYGLFDLVNDGYFEQGLDTAKEFRAHYGLKNFPKFDLFRTMHGGVKRFLKTKHMRDIFDYFIKYVGSSAHRAPAFMNCLPAIQFRYGLWYVDGGLYGIARGLGRLMEELGVEVLLDTRVEEILRSGGMVTGVRTADGSVHTGDIVLSNVEFIPTHRQLLGTDETVMRKLEHKYTPACSGLVVELGLDRTYPQLAHHNFFFSRDQRAHFRSVFGKRELPDDPTIYLVAASRTDPSVAPDGCEALKILPHIPHLDNSRPLTSTDYEAFLNRVLEKLERMGLTDLRKHVVVQHIWTPHDLLEQYNSNRGSIYGVAADRFRNLAFKAPQQSPDYPNLFFAGGSANPGGGMPMVVLGGQNACRKIVEWDNTRTSS
jgi:diapolycopene oxygenase